MCVCAYFHTKKKNKIIKTVFTTNTINGGELGFFPLVYYSLQNVNFRLFLR